MKRARDEAEFNEHVQRVVVFSLYTADDLPTYGEQVLALSTCDNSRGDSYRCVVLAKEV